LSPASGVICLIDKASMGTGLPVMQNRTAQVLTSMVSSYEMKKKRNIEKHWIWFRNK